MSGTSGEHKARNPDGRHQPMVRSGQDTAGSRCRSPQPAGTKATPPGAHRPQPRRQLRRQNSAVPTSPCRRHPTPGRSTEHNSATTHQRRHPIRGCRGGSRELRANPAAPATRPRPNKRNPPHVRRMPTDRHRASDGTATPVTVVRRSDQHPRAADRRLESCRDRVAA